ncbi:hypothetical protein ACLB1S_08750 [Escherichia coli]
MATAAVAAERLAPYAAAMFHEAAPAMRWVSNGRPDCDNKIAHQLTRITTSGCRLVNHTGVGNGLFDIRQRLHHAIDFAQFNTLPAGSS